MRARVLVSYFSILFIFEYVLHTGNSRSVSSLRVGADVDFKRRYNLLNGNDYYYSTPAPFVWFSLFRTTRGYHSLPKRHVTRYPQNAIRTNPPPPSDGRRSLIRAPRLARRVPSRLSFGAVCSPHDTHRVLGIIGFVEHHRDFRKQHPQRYHCCTRQT